MKPLANASLYTVVAIVLFVFGFMRLSLTLLILAALVAIVGLYWVNKAGGFNASKLPWKK